MFAMSTLRQTKAAKIRLALLDALVERLVERPLDGIPTKELCRAVGISEPTFYKYFPQKSDLLTYFIQLWSVEGAARAFTVAEADGALAGLHTLFEDTGDGFVKHPALMLEVIRHQSRMGPEHVLQPLASIDRRLRFGDRPDLDALPDLGLGALLPDLIGRAICEGALPASVDVGSLTLALACIFFGVPLVVGPRAPDQVPAAYRAQLALALAGARAMA
ncbi:MAG: AcrR family transcriptional regulator [Myxococcota bacterium]|jgi:AcrR family transcriptional regulator